jgi:hypothetical protein
VAKKLMVEADLTDEQAREWEQMFGSVREPRLRWRIVDDPPPLGEEQNHQEPFIIEAEDERP